MISYERLFRTMHEKNVTTYKLFKQGFSSSVYYSIKRGNSVSTNTIDHLCRILECEISDIIEYLDEPAVD